MKVFLPIATNQILKVRARFFSGLYDLHLRQELTDTTTVISDCPASLVSGYANVTFAHPFTEGENYEIEIISGGLTAWKGKAFITARTPSTYKMHTNV